MFSGKSVIVRCWRAHASEMKLILRLTFTRSLGSSHRFSSSEYHSLAVHQQRKGIHSIHNQPCRQSFAASALLV